MPAGFDVTVPVPVPVLVTTSVKLRANDALTAVSPLTVKVQPAVPVQPPPLQPRKLEAPDGAAASVTWVPNGTDMVQAPGQLMPAGVEVTVPVPLPPTATVTVCISS